MSRAAQIVEQYLTESDVIQRWPMLDAKELKRARKKEQIMFYNFRSGPCYTAEQVQEYIDKTYLKGTPCESNQPLPQDLSRSQQLPQPTRLSNLEASISTGHTRTEEATSMPAGMTPELAASAVNLLAQRTGRKPKSSLPRSSSPPQPPAKAQYPVLIKS